MYFKCKDGKERKIYASFFSEKQLLHIVELIKERGGLHEQSTEEIIYNTSGEKKYRMNPKNFHDVKLEKQLFKELKALGHNFHCSTQFHSKTFTEKDKEVIPIILKYLDMFKQENNKIGYLLSLGTEGFYDATEYLVSEYRKHAPPNYNWLFLNGAAQTIGHIQDPRFIDEYVELLNDNVLTVETSYLVHMLGKMKVGKAVPHLIRLLDRENAIADCFSDTSCKFVVSITAIEALSEFKDPDHIKHVEKFLEPEKIPWIKYPDTKEGRSLLKKTYAEYRKIAQVAIKKMGGSA